jgi:hypothetical protein
MGSSGNDIVKAIECLSQRLCAGSIPDNYLQRKVPQVILWIIALNSHTKAESSTSFASRIPSISPGDTFGQPAAVMVRTLESVLPNNPSLNKTSSDKNDGRTKGDRRRLFYLPWPLQMFVPNSSLDTTVPRTDNTTKPSPSLGNQSLL